MTKETAAKASFYISIGLIAESALFVAWFLSLIFRVQTLPSDFYTDNVPVSWYILGVLDQLAILLAVAGGVYGYRSSQRKAAFRGLVLTGLSLVIKFSVPFAVMVYVMATAGASWD